MDTAMALDDLVSVSQFVGAIVGVCSLVVAAGALWLNAQQARSSAHFARLAQEANAFQAFNARFAEIAKRRQALIIDPAPDLRAVREMYYDYWALQVDQWEYYRRRVVSDDTYLSWSTHVFDTARGRQRFGEYSSKQAWADFGVSVSRNTPDFRYLGDMIVDLASQYGAGPLKPSELKIVRASLRQLIQRVRDLGPDGALDKTIAREQQA